jgi:tetratricopeptide (TPR) repeat protein
MSVTARLFASVTALVLFTLGFSTPVRAQTQQQIDLCAGDGNPTPDLVIGACTAVIQSGKLVGVRLSAAFQLRGAAYAGKGQYDRAIQDFDQAIKLNPKEAETFVNRGGSYDKKGQYDRAIQDFDQAIKLNPSYASAFMNRGIAYRKKGQHDRAIQDYDQAIKLNPKYAAALYNRSLAKDKKGDKAGAEVDLAAARRINPNIGR